jgi:hypothetical protein
MKRLLLLFMLLLGGMPARASAIQFIPQPDAAYVSATTLLPITGPPESATTAISDGALTISFLSGGSPLWMLIHSVPDSWGTWGAPPDTESSTPMVVAPLDGPDVTSVLYQFSQPLSTFGMELEPDDQAVHQIAVQFLYGGNVQATLSLPVSGDSGARLFAATGGVFDSVLVSSDTDFAAAQFRYAVNTSEPGSLWLFAAGVVCLAPKFCLKRRNT